MRRRRPREVAELDDRADEGLDLHRFPGLDILQHRRLVRTDLFRARDPLVDPHTKLHAELVGDRLGFLRSEEHTSELQSRFGISYAAFCLKKNHQSPPSTT